MFPRSWQNDKMLRHNPFPEGIWEANKCYGDILFMAYLLLFRPPRNTWRPVSGYLHNGGDLFDFM